MPTAEQLKKAADIGKQVLKPINDTAGILIGETMQLARGVLDTLAATHLDPNDVGNLANVIGHVADFFKEFFEWYDNKSKKEKEAAEQEKQKGGAKKGDGSSFDPESIGDFLKQYSDVITQNADTIKKFLPKELSDKLLSYTVPANAAAKGLKNPSNANESINKLIDYSPDSIRNNPAGYKALYDSSKAIVDNAKDLKNVQNNPQLKNAMLAMTRIGPVLCQTNPALTKNISNDLRNNMEKSPEFRQMAVQSAQSRLSRVGGLQGYNNLNPNQKGFADMDVRTVLLASSLNRGLTDRKQIFNDVNRNFSAFQKDAAKGLSVVTNNNSINRANQRIQYARKNPAGPRPVPVQASPLPELDEKQRKNMLSSVGYRQEQVNNARSHLKDVLNKTGCRTGADVSKLPKNVQDEIGKDVGTILYGANADAAIAAKGKEKMDNAQAINDYANSKDINSLTNDTANAFFKNPNADFTALLDDNKTEAIGKQTVERNSEIFKKSLEKESAEKNPNLGFDDAAKDDMLRSSHMRAEKTQDAQNYIREFAKDNNLKTKEDFDKLSPDQRKTFDDCVKTVAFAHAADAALGRMDKGEISDPAVRNQLINSKGLNETVNKGFDNFCKEPADGMKLITKNSKLQQIAKQEMGPHMNEFRSIAKSDKVPAPKTIIVNPDLGVEKKQQPKGPQPLSSEVKKDMLKSSAMRNEKIEDAKNNMKSIIDKNGGPENISIDKLSAADRNSLNMNAQTIAFGNAADSILGGKGGQLADPAKQDQVINSDVMNSFVNNTTQQFMANPKTNTETLLDDKAMGEVSAQQVGNKLGQIKDVVQHDQIVNEEPIESFDDNLKKDMLKSKAFRDEKINEAQMHMKTTLEENGVKTNEDFGKLPKTVQTSLDKDAKTIIYGHVAENALSQNGIQKLTDPSMQSKFMNSSKTNLLVDKSLENFQKDPMGNIGNLTSNEVMAQQAAKTNATFQRELHSDTFDRKLQENMLKSQSFRKEAVENATNSIKGIIGEDGKMSAEKYNALSQEAKNSYDASVKTIAFGQMANRALKTCGAKEITDQKAVNQLINSKCLKDFTSSVADKVQKDPGSITKVLDDIGMRNATKGAMDYKANGFKVEIQGIMLDENLDLKQTLGSII